MNIREIRVKNFRSLRDAKLSCDHLTAIVGRNGTGKSSFLRALEIFYDQTATATPDDFYNGDIDRDISITVTFSGLTPGALRLFSPYVNKGTLSITRVFSGEQGRNNGKYHGSRLRNEEFTPVRKRRGDAGGYGRVQSTPSGSARQVRITTVGHEGNRRPCRARRLGGSASGGVQPGLRRGSVLWFHRCWAGVSREAHRVHPDPDGPELEERHKRERAALGQEHGREGRELEEVAARKHREAMESPVRSADPRPARHRGRVGANGNGTPRGRPRRLPTAGSGITRPG